MKQRRRGAIVIQSMGRNWSDQHTRSQRQHPEQSSSTHHREFLLKLGPDVLNSFLQSILSINLWLPLQNPARL